MSKEVIYVTGNPKKVQNAAAFLDDYNIEVTQEKVSLQEIQAEDAVEIAVKKARDAYEVLQRPLFINDASWHIPALGGFPGPFMHYIVDWFTVDDILNLMRDKQDRSIILRDTIVFKDGDEEKIFTNDVHGVILNQPTEGDGPFITKVVSLQDDGKSIAEAKIVGYSDKEKPLWQAFAEWYTARH